MQIEEEMKSLVKYAKPTMLNSQLLKANINGGNQEQENNIGHENNTEFILNSILPPREYTIDKKQLYIENVLSTPATRQEVIDLNRQLNLRLQKRGARIDGICPIREDLFSQCFDELIRQITINCSHRGLLLVRLRDELNMNLECYQKLYESAMAYGLRKALIFENQKNQMKNDINKLDEEIEELQIDIQKIQSEIQLTEEKSQKSQLIDEQKHNEEIQNIKKKNLKLKEELEKRLSVQFQQLIFQSFQNFFTNLLRQIQKNKNKIYLQIMLPSNQQNQNKKSNKKIRKKSFKSLSNTIQQSLLFVQKDKENFPREKQYLPCSVIQSQNFKYFSQLNISLENKVQLYEYVFCKYFKVLQLNDYQQIYRCIHLINKLIFKKKLKQKNQIFTIFVCIIISCKLENLDKQQIQTLYNFLKHNKIKKEDIKNEEWNILKLLDFEIYQTTLIQTHL